MNVKSVCVVRLELKGTPRECGRGHGEALRGRIAEGLDAWESSLQAPAGATLDEHIARFLAEVDYESALERWVPGHLQEIRGIAEGANQPLARVLFYNLGDEYVCWDPVGGPFIGCSAIGLAPRGVQSTVVAQNVDLPCSFAGPPVVLEIENPGQPRVALLAAAGVVGYCGANDAGLAVCCNALPSLAARTSGVTVLGCVRAALRRRSVAEVARLLTSIRIATPQNYLVGDPGQVKDFECSAEGVTPIENGGQNIWHTNHPLAEHRTTPPADPGNPSNSHRRGRFLDEIVPSLTDANQVLSALCDRSAPVCRIRGEDGDSHTWGAIVIEVSRPPKISIAPGPPDRTALERVW